MSLKKIHEVEIMAKYVSDLASNRSIDNVVDVGAGQGYLSSGTMLSSCSCKFVHILNF